MRVAGYRLMKLMIIDRNTKRRLRLCSMLSSRGHFVQVATTSDNALSILRAAEDPPRLILLDPNVEEQADWLLGEIWAVAPQAKVFWLGIRHAVTL